MSNVLKMFIIKPNTAASWCKMEWDCDCLFAFAFAFVQSKNLVLFGFV